MQADWEAKQDNTIEGRIKKYQFDTHSINQCQKSPSMADFRQKMLMTTKELSMRHSEKETMEIKRMQDANDTLYIVGMAMKNKWGCSYEEAVMRSKTFSGLRQQFASSDLTKALYTGGSATGAEFIPTGFSAEVTELYRLELKVAQLFATKQINTKTYDDPVNGSDPIAYYIPESSSDTEGVANPSTPGTAKVTATAKKLKTRCMVSVEETEDSILNEIANIKMQIAQSIANAREKAIIDGDTAGTQDSDNTTTTDARRIWNGLRQMTQSGCKKSLSTFNYDVLLTMPGSQGKYGVMPKDGAWIVGAAGYFKLQTLRDSNNNLILISNPNIGQLDPAINGIVGMVAGRPVVVSEYIREDLNASGVYDGTTTTKSVLLHVNRKGFKNYERTGIVILSIDWLDTDQVKIIGRMRGDFQPVFPAASNKIVSLGYNF